MSKGELLLYRAVRAILVAFCRLFWRVRIDGAANVPASGPFVLAPVHRSNVDTPLVAGITKRRMRFMGKDSMWKVKSVGKLFTALGGSPALSTSMVRRSASRSTVPRCTG